MHYSNNYHRDLIDHGVAGRRNIYRGKLAFAARYPGVFQQEGTVGAFDNMASYQGKKAHIIMPENNLKLEGDMALSTKKLAIASGFKPYVSRPVDNLRSEGIFEPQLSALSTANGNRQRTTRMFDNLRMDSTFRDLKKYINMREDQVVIRKQMDDDDDDDDLEYYGEQQHYPLFTERTGSVNTSDTLVLDHDVQHRVNQIQERVRISKNHYDPNLKSDFGYPKRLKNRTVGKRTHSERNRDALIFGAKSKRSKLIPQTREQSSKKNKSINLFKRIFKNPIRMNYNFGKRIETKKKTVNHELDNFVDSHRAKNAEELFGTENNNDTMILKQDLEVQQTGKVKNYKTMIFNRLTEEKKDRTKKKHNAVLFKRDVEDTGRNYYTQQRKRHKNTSKNIKFDQDSENPDIQHDEDLKMPDLQLDVDLINQDLQYDEHLKNLDLQHHEHHDTEKTKLAPEQTNNRKDSNDRKFIKHFEDLEDTEPNNDTEAQSALKVQPENPIPNANFGEEPQTNEDHEVLEQTSDTTQQTDNNMIQNNITTHKKIEDSDLKLSEKLEYQDQMSETPQQTDNNMIQNNITTDKKIELSNLQLNEDLEHQDQMSKTPQQRDPNMIQNNITTHKKFEDSDLKLSEELEDQDQMSETPQQTDPNMIQNNITTQKKIENSDLKLSEELEDQDQMSDTPRQTDPNMAQHNMTEKNLENTDLKLQEDHNDQEQISNSKEQTMSQQPHEVVTLEKAVDDQKNGHDKAHGKRKPKHKRIKASKLDGVKRFMTGLFACVLCDLLTGVPA